MTCLRVQLAVAHSPPRLSPRAAKRTQLLTGRSVRLLAEPSNTHREQFVALRQRIVCGSSRLSECGPVHAASGRSNVVALAEPCHNVTQVIIQDVQCGPRDMRRHASIVRLGNPASDAR